MSDNPKWQTKEKEIEKYRHELKILQLEQEQIIEKHKRELEILQQSHSLHNSLTKAKSDEYTTKLIQLEQYEVKLQDEIISHKELIHQEKRRLNIQLFSAITISIGIILPFLVLNSNLISISVPKLPVQNTSSVSNSMSVEKVIAWFCAGALGYAAFYAIGKNISEK